MLLLLLLPLLPVLSCCLFFFFCRICNFFFPSSPPVLHKMDGRCRATRLPNSHHLPIQVVANAWSIGGVIPAPGSLGHRPHRHRRRRGRVFLLVGWLYHNRSNDARRECHALLRNYVENMWALFSCCGFRCVLEVEFTAVSQGSVRSFDRLFVRSFVRPAGRPVGYEGYEGMRAGRRVEARVSGEQAHADHKTNCAA